MNIELTEEQYRKMLTLTFLGDWIAGGLQHHEDGHKELQDFADYIYSLAPQFGAEDWVEWCPNCGTYHANQAMEEALFPMIDQYDEDTFWDVLSHHLAYRDVMVTDGGRKGLGDEKNLPPEVEMRLFRRKEQYEQEFQRHGLDHVRLVFHGGKKSKP